ncbi:N-6 DNA methylase, partial [bacterium]|nr:N-6 DNA methylase [bacterium]
LPVTLWFLDKGKPESRKEKVLFIDARKIYRQIDRAHRDFRPEQLEFLSNIVRLYRGEDVETHLGSLALLDEYFQEGKYKDIKGLCKVTTLDEIEAKDWSLNPGRYVGVEKQSEEDIDFILRLEELNEELEVLNNEARKSEQRIAKNISQLLK